MRLSIITVCMNSCETIERTILSVLKQLESDDEYIIIDGGSKDGTVDIIKKYAERLSYWCSESDDGVYDAMNKGISKAKGDIIGIINSDDWYEDKIFSYIKQLFNDNEDADVIFGAINRTCNEKVISTTRMNGDVNDIRVHMIYNHPGSFARRAVFDKIGGFDLAYRIAADYEWILRAYISGCVFYLSSRVHANFTIGGISRRALFKSTYEAYRIANKYASDELTQKRIQEYYDKMLPLNRFIDIVTTPKSEIDARYDEIFEIELRDRPCYLWGAGDYGQILADAFMRYGIVVEAFIDKYKKDNYVNSIPVIAPEDIKRGMRICISTTDYENEIRLQIKGMDIPDSDVISITDVPRRIDLKYIDF